MDQLVPMDAVAKVMGRAPDERHWLPPHAVWRAGNGRAIVEWCDGRVIWYDSRLEVPVAVDMHPGAAGAPGSGGDPFARRDLGRG